MAANLKEVRERIKSVKNTQQITKAMKMVSAAKLRRAQDAILQMRPYSDKLDNMLRNILSNLEGDVETAFGVERPIQKGLLVVITSNRGLCGSFNSNVIKAAEALIGKQYAELKREGNLTILPIGKRGYDHFRRHHKEIPLIQDYVELFNDLSFDHVAQVSQMLMDAFEEGEFDSIHIAYGRFKNAAVQFPEVEQWLPVAKMEAAENDFRSNYIFEPGKESLLEYLIPTILKTTFHKYILDTHASEHGARMTAMDAATENADELLKELRISYNKARQEAITKELSEIVGGAAALEG
jgi:F-type H+-transporting ATPase subunit gamma